MNRDDYERKTIPSGNLDIRILQLTPARSLNISSMGDDMGQPNKIGITFKVQGYDNEFVFLITSKESVDAIVEGMIAARNGLWPT